jgi:hypothetical protein
MHRVLAQRYKRGPVRPIVYFQDKQKVFRIGAYFLNPVCSDIYFDLWSDWMNELTIKIRYGGNILSLGLANLNHIPENMGHIFGSGDCPASSSARYITTLARNEPIRPIRGCGRRYRIPLTLKRLQLGMLG